MWSSWIAGCLSGRPDVAAEVVIGGGSQEYYVQTMRKIAGPNLVIRATARFRCAATSSRLRHDNFLHGRAYMVGSR